MAGMSLGSGPGASGLMYRGPIFVPGAQAAGSTQTGRATTLATAAYGTTASPATGGPRTAHFGSVAAALVGAGLIAFMWWSLPR